MANNKSVEKILNFLEKENKPKTKSEIVEACSLPNKSVEDCLILLKKFDRIEIITNGKTSLIILKKQTLKQNATNTA